MDSKRGWIFTLNPSLFINLAIRLSNLALADFEHLCAAYGANALRCRPAILHRDCLGILHISLGPALHTIALHWVTSLFF